MLGLHNKAVGRINGMAALREFSYKKIYGRLAGTKKVAVIGCNNEVSLLTR